jgi:hypothetical protein
MAVSAAASRFPARFSIKLVEISRAAIGAHGLRPRIAASPKHAKPRVQRIVISHVLKDREIRRLVIALDLVRMMHDGFQRKQMPQGPFHDQNVLLYVAFVLSRMVRAI